MTRDVVVYIEDILRSIDRIAEYLRDVTLETFRDDQKTIDAVIRNFEIIGEATKRIPRTIVEKYPHVPWSDAAAMRDVLIHDYPDILLDVVWHTSKENLPVFKQQLETIRRDIETK